MLWIVVGLFLVGLAAALYVDRRAAWPVVGIIGLFLAVCGLGFIRSRLEVHADAIIWFWAFSRHRCSLADLVDATLASPLRPGQSGGAQSSIAWVNAGSNGFVIGAGYLIKFVFHVLAWVAVPGSTDGESLHLIPRLGGAIPVRSISTRLDRKNDRAHFILAVVRQAIASHNEATENARRQHEEPLGWQQSLPSWNS